MDSAARKIIPGGLLEGGREVFKAATLNVCPHHFAQRFRKGDIVSAHANAIIPQYAQRKQGYVRWTAIAMNGLLPQ